MDAGQLVEEISICRPSDRQAGPPFIRNMNEPGAGRALKSAMNWWCAGAGRAHRIPAKTIRGNESRLIGPGDPTGLSGAGTTITERRTFSERDRHQVHSYSV